MICAHCSKPIEAEPVSISAFVARVAARHGLKPSHDLVNRPADRDEVHLECLEPFLAARVDRLVRALRAEY